MGRYRKKPVEIEAVRYDGTNWDEIATFMGRTGRVEETKLPGPGRGMHDGTVIHTLEGDMTASVGDWIIRGVQGECYPCKPDIFAATYEPA
ncbi:hypothetical protein [Streptomyces sp. NPDC087525]|uniref:hypothetical protein n=1 Tax=Streptomyces sp. NPDC087525 TaxID=3365793 RepID=UPI0038188793